MLRQTERQWVPKASTGPKHGRSEASETKDESESDESVAAAVKRHRRESKKSPSSWVHRLDHVNLTSVLVEADYKLKTVRQYVKDHDLIRDDCDLSGWYIRSANELGSGRYGLVLEICDSAFSDATEPPCRFAVKLIKSRTPFTADAWREAISNEFIMSRVAGEAQIGPFVYDACFCVGNIQRLFRHGAIEPSQKLLEWAADAKSVMYLIMEKVGKQTLRQFVEQWAITRPDLIQAVMSRVDAQVEKLMDMYITHADIHLSNILVSYDEDNKDLSTALRTWVIDYGDAWICDSEENPFAGGYSLGMVHYRNEVETLLNQLEHRHVKVQELLSRAPSARHIVQSKRDTIVDPDKVNEKNLGATHYHHQKTHGKMSRPRSSSHESKKEVARVGKVEGKRVQGAALRLSRHSEPETSWSQLHAEWSVEDKQATLTVDLLGTSPLAQATRLHKWGRERKPKDPVERHHILDIWFTRPEPGSSRARDGVWHLEWFFSRAVEDGKFRDAYRHFSSDEERQEFQQIGRRFLCLLLAKIARVGRLRKDQIISVHALPSEKDRLVKYYHDLGFRRMKKPHATDIPDKWTPMSASILTLLQHCQ